MEKLFIGREEEIRILTKAYEHSEARFVAIFGRRRVGKTYLIRRVFDNKVAFYMTGISGVTAKQQIFNFHTALLRQGGNFATVPKNWFSAFQNLIDFLEASHKAKKVVFLDELPPADWTYEWQNYIATGNATEVNLALDRLIQAIMYSPEYQTF